MAIRRIGQIFVDMGFIDDDQLEMLVEEQQQQPGEKIGKIAEEMGLITDDQLAQALEELRAVVRASRLSFGVQRVRHAALFERLI